MKALEHLETEVLTQGGPRSTVHEARLPRNLGMSQELWGKETRRGLTDGLELVPPEMFSLSSRPPLDWHLPNPGGDPQIQLKMWDSRHSQARAP